MLTVRAQGTKLLNCRLQQPRFRGEKPSSVDGVCSMQVWVRVASYSCRTLVRMQVSTSCALRLGNA